MLTAQIINRLRLGRRVAAEVLCNEAGMRAWVVVIPQAPLPQNHTESWYPYTPEERQRSHGEMRLVDAAPITGYEIRYVRHKAEYTDELWGWDYDKVLDDETTRIKRVFVERESDIPRALAAWLPETSPLAHPHDFDSSLLNSPIEGYLSRPMERPHLWTD